MTNVEFVTDLMEFSQTGAMAQLVVLTALEKYTEQVLAKEAEVLESMKKGYFSGPAWVAACREINAAIKKREGR